MSDAERNMRKFVDHFTKVTVRIATWDSNKNLKSRSSGFIYQPEKSTVPIVVTAGHELPEAGSFIETRITKNGTTLAINAGKFHVFYNAEGIDYAYSELPIELYQKDIQQFNGVDLYPINMSL